MKRDMDLVRAILLAIEGNSFRRTDAGLSLDGYTPRDIARHLRLLSEAGYAEANLLILEREGAMRASEARLTWKGYEFLDSIRGEGVWGHVKEQAGSLGQVPFEVMKALGIAYLKEKLGLP